MELVQWLVGRGCSFTDSNNYRTTPLLHATIQGHLELVKWFIEQGCSIYETDFLNTSLLLLASESGKWLIEKGLSVDDFNLEHKTCLTIASIKGDIELVKYLVDIGCSLQENDNNGTCIMNAAMNNHVELVVWMLCNGSSLDENTYTLLNNYFTKESCRDILERNGLLEKVKTLYTTKYGRK